MLKDCLHVVVVDDVVRFALHVWRYLSRGIGFGIGAVSADEESYFYSGGAPTFLETPDGRAAVWWVPASDEWLSRLPAVLRQIERKPALFVLDVKAKHMGTSSTRRQGGDYNVKDVLTWLKEQGFQQSSIMIVSSYARRVKAIEDTKGGATETIAPKLWPKSPEMLREIERRLPTLSPSLRVGEPSTLDVLVTGAGFEFRFEHEQSGSGGQRSDQGFGLPRTSEILGGMGEPFGDPDGLLLKAGPNEGSFPVPDRVKAPYRGSLFELLANEGMLDEWWSLLLETELHYHLRSSSGMPMEETRRREAKRAAWRNEVKLRGAYRNAILAHDWGHLAQSLHAARLPWFAWLTTNYTRFADRAISLVGQAKARDDIHYAQAAPWRVIATADEALLFMRELQDREEGRRDPRGGPRSSSGNDERPLFKLHGDVSHLQTMAIAGYDKDLFSLLSVPVDSLHQVYSAAERFLTRTLPEEGKEQITMRWHIVGHGLRDEALLQVLRRVVQSRSDVVKSRSDHNMEFRVVAPDPAPAREILEEELKKVTNANSLPVKAVPASAESYMARLGGIG